MYKRQAAASQVNITAIMNPNSGPSNAVNADYTAAVGAFRAAGGKVVGYVSTQYGARDESAVLADVNAYKNFYTIDGIFLDEMHNIAATLPYYENLRTSIAGVDSNYKVFGNAGTNTLEGDVYKRQGLCKVDYYNLSAGVVALHKGYKT